MGGVKKGLENATLASAKILAKSQTGIDRVLWGKDAMVYSAQQGVSGSASVTGAARASAAANTTSAKPKPKNPLDLGLLPVLDIIISVDLCNIIDYLASSVGGKVPKKRPEKPTGIEKGLYYVQDQALFVQKSIDTFLATPNSLIGKYTGLGPEVKSQEQVAKDTNQPPPPQGSTAAVPGASTSGTNTQRYNLKNLLDYIKSTFANGMGMVDGKSIFTPEDQQLLTEVPGLTSNLNILNDFLASTDKYTDYRNIPNEDLKKILEQINVLRVICVVIQGLDLRNPQSYLTTATAIFPPGSVREQTAKIQKWLNPQQIIPVVKQINDATKSFIGTVQQGQKVLAQGQFIIKIGLLLIKVFKFIVAFLKKLPIPGMATTVGANVTFSSIANRFEKFLDELTDILAQVNSLLAVLISFLRYVQANTLQLIDRLQRLLDMLSTCDSTKDSPVVAELAATLDKLKTLNTQISDYLTLYDDKTDPSKAVFGTYSVQVIDEEVTDKNIPNKRRRGIALDKNGIIAVQSDLTFATDVKIIIQEVKLKLLSAGLIQPGLGGIDANITVISDSLSFLDTNDVIQDDLNLGNTGESIGLNDFLDNLPGGKALRQRVRSNLDSSKAAFADKIKAQKTNTSKIFKK